MVRSYQGILAALAGLAVVATSLGTGAFFGALYAPHQKHYQAEAGDKTGQNDYNGPSQSLLDIASLPGFVERAIANPRPQTGEDHEKRDLAAQEASALWAFWTVTASFLSVLITAIGTIFLYNQIVLTRKAVEGTNRTIELAEAAQRPWVTVKIDVRKMYRLGKAFRWDFDIISENVGKTVAVDYCSFFHVVIYKPHELSNIESWFNADDPNKITERDVILPGETITRQRGYGVLDRDNIWSSFSTQIAKGLEIIVGIDVFYKFKESTEWYQTRRSFKISKTLSDGSASCFLPTDSLETNFTVTDCGVGLAK
jgi:hypothetical protein